MIELHVVYTVKNGFRDEFYEKVVSEKIAEASRSENGNIMYEYLKPLDNENTLFLLEMWENEEALSKHSEASHYLKLKELKNDYVLSTDITRFHSEKL